MNIIKFAIWLGGVYAAYYFGLILWDLINSRRSPKSIASNELTFTEDIEPFRMETENFAEPVASAMISSGGVNLQQLFMLAREEAIEYTRAVSF
jgi:hypothetical protein